jgi:aminopeptidase
VIDADAHAALICDWCLEVEDGQQVLVTTTTLAAEPARALHGALLRRGAWPLLRLAPAGVEAGFYANAGPAQLDGVAPAELAFVREIDAFVGIQAPLNTRALTDVDPALIARVQRAQQAVREARLAKRWVGTIWPTPALAQEAAMSEHDYAAFVQRALFLDCEDPVAAWRELSARQAELVKRLSVAREVRIQSEGTDLRLDVSGRTWINSDGRRNMPSGEVFTGPHETSASGTIRFDVPSLRDAATVAGIEVVFAEGRVVAARAEVGDEHLQAALAIDDGARFLGELGIGTNTGIDRATGSTLLDEKIAGTIHLALGRSYPETGGVNVSALHWDLICDLRSGGQVSVDNETLIRDGVFVE